MSQPSPSNIARIDIEAKQTHGWQVRITRQRKRHTKFFSDSVYGDEDKALEAAIEYRDQLKDELPEALTGHVMAAKARSTSGVPGIRLTIDRGIPRIEADSMHPKHGRRVRTFSLRKWGLRRALWKACTWKYEAVHDVLRTDAVSEMYETAYPTIRKQLDEAGVWEVVADADEVDAGVTNA